MSRTHRTRGSARVAAVLSLDDTLVEDLPTIGHPPVEHPEALPPVRVDVPLERREDAAVLVLAIGRFM